MGGSVHIHSNDQKGIALLHRGNSGLAAPVISLATQTRISGMACANCTVEIFSDMADEGAIYEGTTIADASGRWSLSKPAGFAGPNLTATATDAAGNTSEFSSPFAVANEKHRLYLLLIFNRHSTIFTIAGTLDADDSFRDFASSRP